MPLYEYTCDRCNSQFELLIRSSGEKAACPECGTSKVTKQLSVPAAHSASRPGAPGLPVCEAPRGGPSRASGSIDGCGLPQCGTGGCMGMGL